MSVFADLPVAVDATGGDDAPEVIIEGARRANAAGVPVMLVGDVALLRDRLAGLPIEVRAGGALDAAAGAVEVRRRGECAVRVAARAVAGGEACALVSCGSSAGTLVAAVLDIGLLDGVERPALAASLPRADGGTVLVVDVGASVECRADHLLCFAQLGAAFAGLGRSERPTVGLLANGAEVGKGNRLVKEVDPLLMASGLRYVGRVEPHTALAGACDVLVTDGFAGNILLKTAEGVVELIGRRLRAEVAGDPGAGAAWAELSNVVGRVRSQLDWRSRGGGLLLGVRAPVVIGHGRTDAAAVDAAIRLAHYGWRERLVAALETARAPAASAPGDEA